MEETKKSELSKVQLCETLILRCKAKDKTSLLHSQTHCHCQTHRLHEPHQGQTLTHFDTAVTLRFTVYLILPLSLQDKDEAIDSSQYSQVQPIKYTNTTNLRSLKPKHCKYFNIDITLKIGKIQLSNLQALNSKLTADSKQYQVFAKRNGYT